MHLKYAHSSVIMRPIILIMTDHVPEQKCRPGPTKYCMFLLSNIGSLISQGFSAGIGENLVKLLL